MGELELGARQGRLSASAGKQIRIMMFRGSRVVVMALAVFMLGWASSSYDGVEAIQHEFDYNQFAGDEMPIELLDEDWDPIPGDMGATSFAQVEAEVTAGEKQELECNCEKMKCNCLKKCECAVPAKR